jgi:quercetin dioxygenase-like cupin family protein
MANTSVTKVSSGQSPTGEMGQKYLASGITTAMRMWEDEQPGEAKAPAAREYETVGFVIKGRAELHIEGQVVVLEPGDSWVVNKGQQHAYKILEPFTAVEATTPPARAHGRDAR